MVRSSSMRWPAPDRIPLGTIVFELERSLNESAADIQRSRIWSAFDEVFGVRLDYRFWRSLGRPAFSHRGKIAHLQPAVTTLFPSLAPIAAVDCFPKIGNVDALTRTARLGLLGALVDYLDQAEREGGSQKPVGHLAILAARLGRTQIDEFLPENSLKPEISDFLIAGTRALCCDFEGPSEALLLVACLGQIASLRSLTAVDLNLVEVLQRALSEFDPRFDLLRVRKRPGLHGLSLTHWRTDDLSGGRIVPAPDADQILILSRQIENLGKALLNKANQALESGIDPTPDLFAFSQLSSANVVLLMRLRSKVKILIRNSNQHTPSRSDEFFLYRLSRACRTGAEAAELVGDGFRCAKLWCLAVVHAGTTAKLPIPKYCFRLIREAGFWPFADNRRLSHWRIEASNVALKQWKVKQVAKACEHEWSLLWRTVEPSPTTPEWHFLQHGLNELVKTRTELISQEVARAGLRVALAFDRVELANDFLGFIRDPDAQDIGEFLHKVRLAFQWGSWAVNFGKATAWLKGASDAIGRCSSLENLSLADRLYMHETMSGRFVKLARALPDDVRSELIARFMRRNQLGEVDTPEIIAMLRSETEALCVGFGEIRLADFQRRLQTLTHSYGGPVIGLSIYITRDGMSYCWVLPTSFGNKKRLGGYLELKGLASSLDAIKVLRPDFCKLIQTPERPDGLSWQSLPPWNLELKEFLAKQLRAIQQTTRVSASHILLSVNATYAGLPWQHLLAVVAYESRAAGRGIGAPTVSLVSTFGQLIDKPKNPYNRRAVVFPGPESPKDLDILQARRLAEASIHDFILQPRFNIGIAIGHGISHGADDDFSYEPISLPSIEIDDGVFISSSELEEVLAQDIVVLASCGAGGTGAALFGDMGAVLGMFFLKSSGLLFAPVTDVSPETCAVMIREITGSRGSIWAIQQYYKACDVDICSIYFNAYGIPGALDGPQLKPWASNP